MKLVLVFTAALELCAPRTQLGAAAGPVLAQVQNLPRVYSLYTVLRRTGSMPGLDPSPNPTS